jgi:hypothetical protein
MKIKTYFFSVDIKRIKHPKKYPPRQSDYCDVCGDKVGTAWKTKHMIAQHPDYNFTIGPDGKVICWNCGEYKSTIGGIASHYRECHPEKVHAEILDPEAIHIFVTK